MPEFCEAVIGPEFCQAPLGRGKAGRGIVGRNHARGVFAAIRAREGITRPIRARVREENLRATGISRYLKTINGKS